MKEGITAHENHEATKLLFAHLQAFANTHDMSLPTKAHNLQTETPQTSNSINDNLNQPIHSPIPVNRKGRPPNKRLKSTCEMAQKQKKTVHNKRTSSSNNVVSINLVWYASTLLFITWYMLITFLIYLLRT